MAFNKIQKLLFYLIIFLIPCNLGKHFIQPWSYVNGILIDYLIPTLYLTDILVIGLLGLWLLDKVNLELKIKNLELNLESRIKNTKIILLFFVLPLFTLYCLLFTKNPHAVLYKLLKILEFGFLIYYIKSHINIKKDINNLILVLSGSVILQSLLGISQWFKQQSIFGYWFLGEQPYNINTLGIKTISFFGALKIPAYGTFPHPNILAGFLVISLMIILASHKTLLSYLSFILGIMALFLTFSLTSWLTFLMVLILITTNQQWVKVKPAPRLLIIVLAAFCLLFITFNLDPTSLQRRSQLNVIAFKMWLSSPIFGVGLNNFIPRMEEFGQVQATYRFLQPVHNIYLLVLAETGVIGEISLICLIWLIGKRVWSKKNYLLLTSYFSLLFLALFDHYFLTIEQGMLMLSLVLGLSLAQFRKNY